MTKSTKIIIAVFVLAILVLIFFVIRGSEDTWICQDGNWVKHGNPSAPAPTEPCGQENDGQQNGNEQDTSDKSDLIKVSNIASNQTITSPLLIEGEARGTWYFEASFPVRLLDGQDNLIATGIAQAQSDWMTENFVPFKVELTFSSPTTPEGTIVLEKDNPSGLPENADELRIPIKFELSSETMTIKVYFNNDKMDPEVSCNKVFPVERTVPKTEAVARAALTELLKGTTPADEQQGFFTSINSGVKIEELTIENGVAKVEFDPQLEFQVGGSCRVSAIRAQITETLKQFSTVNSVVISIDGRTEDILQP